MRRYLLEPAGEMLKPESYIATLRMKVKSHKQAGKVKSRPIHDSSRTCFCNAGAFVSEVMERHNTANFPHLVRDSIEVIKAIEEQRVDQGYLVSFDVADYYPTPSHASLTQGARDAYNCAVKSHERKSKGFEDLVALILREQYVTNHSRSAHYCANKGSAIGMKASGGLCDYALAATEVELFESHPEKILSYLRFKDDGLCLINGSLQEIIDLFRQWNTMGEFKVDKICIAGAT